MPHSSERVQMMVQWILAGTLSPRQFLKIIDFYNPGSSCLLISNSLAELLDLPGQPITITLHTVNGARQLQTKYYELYTQARTGTDKWVMAFRVEKISTDLKAIDISGIRHLLMPAIQQW